MNDDLKVRFSIPDSKMPFMKSDEYRLIVRKLRVLGFEIPPKELRWLKDAKSLGLEAKRQMFLQTLQAAGIKALTVYYDPKSRATQYVALRKQP
jgi:hypothetical protein